MAAVKQAWSNALAQLRRRPTTAALVNNAGVPGSAALALGYLLHVDPWGGLHWDTHDFFLGLQCSLPILALYTFEMLPDWNGRVRRFYQGQQRGAQQRERSARQADALALVEAAAGANSGEAEPTAEANGETAAGAKGKARSKAEEASVEASGPAPELPAAVASSSAQAPSPSRQQLPPQPQVLPRPAMWRTLRSTGPERSAPALLLTLGRRQVDAVHNNLGRSVSVAEEAALILAIELAQEMLYRGVLLAAVVKWTIDRLYELPGMDEAVSFYGVTLATPQAGALLGTVGCVVVAVAIEAQAALFPMRQVEEGMRRAQQASEAPGAQLPAAKLRRDKAVALVADSLAQLRRCKLWDVGLSSTGRVVTFTSLSTAFLLSGNLLAPFTAAVAADALWSFYQRLRTPAIEKEELEVLAKLMAMREAARRAKAARVAQLRPGAPPTAGAPPGASGDKEPEGGGKEPDGGADKVPAGVAGGDEPGGSAGDGKL